MKRFFKSLVAILIILSTLLAITSCARPTMDLEDAEEALKDEGYSVSYNDDPSDHDKAEYLRASKDDDYIQVYVFETVKAANLYYESLKMSREFEIDSLKHQIKTIKYKLRAFEDDMKSEEIDALEDQLKELEKDLKEMKEDVVIGKWGKTVWVGTKDALKDSKG